MNRRKFLTLLGVAPAAGIAAAAAPVTPDEPVHVEEWWVEPGHYTSGYCQDLSPYFETTHEFIICPHDGNTTDYTFTTT